ncbi:MAG: broad specificity phosphatase PhoE [Candidatus Promineifilaceae bacterium]|jgi:broad specificity phosphatase PhoE
MKRFVLIRHGQSEDNAGISSRGQGKTLLTNKGEQQAKATGEHWREKPDLIVISPYIRTKQTAEPTMRLFSDIPVKTWPIEEFRQLCAARYEGVNTHERFAHYQAHWDKKDPDFKDGDGVGAESIREFTKRLAKLEKNLQKTDFKLAYVFCHGFFLRAFMLRHLWGTTRPMTEKVESFHTSIRAWHYPNCGIVKGSILEDGSMQLGNISIEHVPRHLRS